MFGRQIACILYIPNYQNDARLLRNFLSTYFTDVFASSSFDELEKMYEKTKSSKSFSVYITIGIEDTSKIRSQHAFTKYLCYNNIQYKEHILKDIKIAADNFYRNIKTNPNFKKNVIVFDLDETLVYNQLNLAYPTLFNDLQKYRQLFDYIILWTHATTDYANEALATINPQYIDENNTPKPFKFDFIISRKSTNVDVFYNKGLAYVLNELNKRDSLISINFAVLIDDKKYNFNNDYDLFVYLAKQPIQHELYAKLFPIIESRYLEYNKLFKYSNIITNENI